MLGQCSDKGCSLQFGGFGTCVDTSAPLNLPILNHMLDPAATSVKGVCGGMSGKEDCCHCLKLRNATTTFQPTTIVHLVTGTTMEPTANSVDGGEEEKLSTMTTDAFSASVKTTLTTSATSTNAATTKVHTESPELDTCEDTGCTEHFGGKGRCLDFSSAVDFSSLASNFDLGAGSPSGRCGGTTCGETCKCLKVAKLDLVQDAYEAAGVSSINKSATAKTTVKAETTDETTTSVTSKTTPSSKLNYCLLGEDHTMCRYPGVGSTCLGDPRLKRGLTTAGRQSLVARHNELRARVANGGEAGQPQARNMRALRWNEELAIIAQRWADQCTWGHDQDRRTLNGTISGQNVFMSFSSRVDTVENMMSKVAEAVTSWYDEVTTPGYDPEGVEKYVFDSATGHYTQVIWAETDQIGCGWTYFNSGGKWQRSYVVCNYAKAGNCIGQPVYQVGAPCSSCPEGTSCNADGLCATSHS